MSNKKRVNPRNIPATMADVKRAKQSAMDEAVNACYAIFFSALRDKMDEPIERLQELWGHVNDLSDSVARGYVTVPDLLNTLKEEAGIVLMRGDRRAK